ncbi:hypothetical protein [Thermomonas sp.]|nr:hypothetical protein [Thermomonas sp.]
MPDPGANRIEPEILFAGEVQEHGFAADFLVQHVIRALQDRGEGD